MEPGCSFKEADRRFNDDRLDAPAGGANLLGHTCECRASPLDIDTAAIVEKRSPEAVPRLTVTTCFSID